MKSKRQWMDLSTRTADWNDGSFRDPAVRRRWLKDARCSLVTRLRGYVGNPVRDFNKKYQRWYASTL